MGGDDGLHEGDDIVSLDQIPLVDPDVPPGYANPPPEVWARQNRATRLTPIVEEYGVEHTDVFGGIVYGRGRQYVGFTQEAADHLARLRQRVDDPNVLRAFVAEHSYAELRETAERVAADMRALRDEGIHITAVGPGPYLDRRGVLQDRVGVTLASRDEGHEATLRERYGPLLEFDEGIWVAGPGTAATEA